LHREVALTNTCTVLSILLNGEYFFVVAFVAFLVVASLGLLALSFEQLMNIAKNIVSAIVTVDVFNAAVLLTLFLGMWHTSQSILHVHCLKVCR
jgi:hypothetical protein